MLEQMGVKLDEVGEVEIEEEEEEEEEDMERVIQKSQFTAHQFHDRAEPSAPGGV